MFFLAPLIYATEFRLDWSGGVYAEWGIVDTCQTYNNLSITGYNIANSSDTITVYPNFSSANTTIDPSNFTECAEYVFDVTLNRDSPGPEITSNRSTDPLKPNIPGMFYGEIKLDFTDV